MDPLRIGVLGASRISADAIVGPARREGHRLVAVAARDRGRADAFATASGVERVLDSYQAVIDDPEVEAVYNPLPNGLHGPWNLAAIEAGKHVLTEKPFASNADEAMTVRFAASAAGVHCMEAFHYRYHPVMLRMLELVADSVIGEVVLVEARMLMPPPAAGDPRWDPVLAGGGLMDVGCYAVHALRSVGELLGGDPAITGSHGRELPGLPGVDAWIEADLEYATGAQGVLASSMTHGILDFSLRIVGTEGEAFAPAFVLPHTDDRVIVTVGTGQRTEELGRRTSYDYQLDAFARLVRLGEPVPTDAADAVSTMRMIDALYAAAGMAPRELLELADLEDDDA